MAVSSFEELRAHIGHEIVCVRYGDEEDADNVAVECETCGEVLFDFDAPDTRLEQLWEQVRKKAKDPAFQVDVLDELVHDIASKIGSAHNNEGPESQVRFLVDVGCFGVDQLADELEIDLTADVDCPETSP